MITGPLWSSQLRAQFRISTGFPFKIPSARSEYTFVRGQRYKKFLINWGANLPSPPDCFAPVTNDSSPPWVATSRTPKAGFSCTGGRERGVRTRKQPLRCTRWRNTWVRTPKAGFSCTRGEIHGFDYISQRDISRPAARPSRISVEEMVTSGAFSRHIL